MKAAGALRSQRSRATNEIIVQTVITNSAGISVNLAYLLFTDLEGKDKVHLTVSSFDMRKYNPDVLLGRRSKRAQTLIL